MPGVASVMDKPPEYCRYSVAKVDVEVLVVAKAAALLDGKTIQEWLSDLVNEASAKSLNRKPVKRKPPKPRPKRE